MSLPSTGTGDAGLDLALEAGPRIITPDTPEDVLKEIGKSKSLAPFREAMRKLKLKRRRIVLGAIRRVCAENRILEKMLEPDSLAMCPEARIPLELVHELEAQEKDSWNPEMREDTLKHYPGLRINKEKR